MAVAGFIGLPARAAEPADGSAAESPAESERDPLPDMAFIEYLGSWEEDDSDWIALAGTTEETESRPAPAERAEDEERSRDEETG